MKQGLAYYWGVMAKETNVAQVDGMGGGTETGQEGTDRAELCKLLEGLWSQSRGYGAKWQYSR